MRPFSINIRGRVKNFNLPKNQPLVPLFEAIVNAIHAIGERKSTDPSFEGQIIIRILRDGQNDPLISPFLILASMIPSPTAPGIMIIKRQSDCSITLNRMPIMFLNAVLPLLCG